jgi:catechol 2,3-dioxygenase
VNSTEATPNGGAKIRFSLHHVTFKTSRLDEMIDWYGRVIGARVQFRDETAAWLTNDDANHRVAFLAVPGLGDDPEKRNHTGMHHSGFECGSFDELMATYDRLKSEGIRPAFCLDHGLTTSIYYRDPEGNYVEMQCDSFGDWAQSGEFIRRSPEFAKNPIGYAFDPEKINQAHRAGIPYAVLQKDIRAGRYEPVHAQDLGLPSRRG